MPSSGLCHPAACSLPPNKENNDGSTLHFLCNHCTARARVCVGGRWMLMKGSYEVVVRGERAGRGITRHGHGPGMSRTHDSFVAIISWS